MLETNNYDCFLKWNYGDLSILYSLLNPVHILNRKSLYNKCCDLLAMYKKTHTGVVEGLGIAFGASGTPYIFNQLFPLKQIIQFTAKEQIIGFNIYLIISAYLICHLIKVITLKIIT